jgi:hypothetical protein
MNAPLSGQNTFAVSSFGTIWTPRQTEKEAVFVSLRRGFPPLREMQIREQWIGSNTKKCLIQSAAQPGAQDRREDVHREPTLPVYRVNLYWLYA